MINKSNLLIRRILGEVEINTVIKRMEGKPLSQVERNYLARSVRPKLLAAKALTEEKIFQKITRPNRSDENRILYSLSKLGYELVPTIDIKKQKLIPIEELIVLILQSHKVRFIEAIPVLILKHRIDKFKLIEIAVRYNLKNKLGYLIETSIIIARKLNIKHDLNDLLMYLEKNKDKGQMFLAEEKDELYAEFLERTSPKRIKRWNLLGRFFDEDFIKNAKVYI